MKHLTRSIAIIMAIVTLLFSLNVTAFAADVGCEHGNTPTDISAFEASSAIPSEIEDPVVIKVPLFNQMHYDDVQYGGKKYLISDNGTADESDDIYEYDWTVASHGCGITCVAMVATYWTNTIWAPDVLAEQFGHYNTSKGSLWTLFEESAEELGVGFDKRCYKWTEAKEALENGQLVVCLQSKGLFTGGGHFILLTGINEEGRVMVNDPNGNNWDKNDTMIKGFKDGFTWEQIYQNATAYFVYEAKPVAG